jgi:hypothetical protein
MSIKKYTNIDGINNKTENEGQFLQADDLFIVSKKEIETTDFGNCKYDAMEVSVYDVNNNLLPHKSGNNVAYVKTGDIKNYMYQITNAGGQKELAIDIEKLLKDLGFTNGILKVNINFVRYRVGSEDGLERVWIQEISPSREEIRILPLKTKFANINSKTNKELKDLQTLNKSFKYYKNSLLDLVNSFENTFLEKIDSALESKYGKDFFKTLKKDFGLSNFGIVRTKIFTDFKTSIDYYLTNKNYDVKSSLFGKPSEIRFEDCDVYDFKTMIGDIQGILNNCIDYNLQSLKKRDVTIKSIPKEFAITELQKQIQDNIKSFSTYSETKRNVYSPDGTVAVFNDADTGFTEPTYPAKGTFIKKICKGYDQYDVLANGNGGTYEELVQVNSPDCGYTPPPPPPPPTGSVGSRGSGGGNTGGGGYNNMDTMNGNISSGRYNRDEKRQR